MNRDIIREHFMSEDSITRIEENEKIASWASCWSDEQMEIFLNMQLHWEDIQR